MTYKEYAYLKNPAIVKEFFRGGVRGCPREIGLDRELNCDGHGTSLCGRCWDQEIKGTVIAEAVKDHTINGSSTSVKKGEKFNVVKVDLHDKTEPCKISIHSWCIGGLWIERENFKFYLEEEKKSMHKVGGRVRVKTWVTLLNEFGLNAVGDIKLSPCVNRGHMRDFCGTIVTIDSVTKDISGYRYTIKEDKEAWVWTDEMFMDDEFNKKDLKDWMFVKLDNEDVGIILGESIITDNGCYSLRNYREDLTHLVFEENNIVAVYVPDTKHCGDLNDVLSSPVKRLLFERKDEEKEISSEEAFKILEEKFGCRVKIKKE